MLGDVGAEAPILKGYVSADGQRLHYVRQGSGPALVLLHASPCSAKVMAPLQALWSPHFTTFAFDLPGFGLSDPPPGESVETWQLADAIAGGIRALGLVQVAAYGRHTGAGVAVEMARRHPELVSMVLTDGFPVFAQPYSDARLAEYLPPIVPAWDGGHLTWTWFRYREQHIFWPWDRSVVAHRSDTDVPDLDFLHRGVVELLEAGDSYRKVYASAFRHPGLAMIGEVTVPVCYGNRPGDSQHKTMKLYPPTAWTREFPRDGLEAAAQERRVLEKHLPAGAVPAHPAWRGDTPAGYVTTRAGAMHVRAEGIGRGGLPVILLHDLPGAAELHDGLLRRLGERHHVIAPDLSGNGHSTAAPGALPDVARWAGEIEDLLDAIGAPRAQLYAVGTAAVVAAELARRAPRRIAGIVLRSPPFAPPAWAEDYAPDITPTREGAHLLRLWHHLRDQELWFPWFTQTRTAARTTPHAIDPADLHRRAVALMRQPRQYKPIWRAVLSYPLAGVLAGLAVPMRVVSAETDLFAAHRDRAAALCGTDAPLADEAAALAWLSSVAAADTAPRLPSAVPEGRAHDRA